MAVNYAVLPRRTTTGEAFSFNNGETTIVPIKTNVELHDQYLNLMNDNKCSTLVYFGLTMEGNQQGFKQFPGNLREEGTWFQLTGNVAIKDSHQQLTCHVANQGHVNTKESNFMVLRAT